MYETASDLKCCRMWVEGCRCLELMVWRWRGGEMRGEINKGK